MKKFVLLLLALCLLGVVFLSWLDGGEPSAPAPEESAAPADAGEAPGEREESGESEEKLSGVDYEAIYALRAPEEIVMTVDGREISWQEYFYYYYTLAANCENNFTKMMYEGVAVGWSSEADAEGNTYAQLLAPSAENLLRRDLAAEQLAEENGIRLTEEDQAELQAAHQEDLDYIASQGYGEERFFEALEPLYMNETVYWRLLRRPLLYEACNQALVGEKGEKLPEELVLDWMEKEGYLSVDRIRIPAGEGAAAQAEELARELQSEEDPAAREALFLERKAELDPEGASYVATQTWIDPAIFERASALEPGQVAEPLELDGDWYVILRRPLRADDEISTTYSREPARTLLAGKGLDLLIQRRAERQRVVYAEGFAPPEVLDYYTRPDYAE